MNRNNSDLNSLFAVFDEWRRWSQLEGEAIQAQDWQRVGECQNAKDLLRPLIVQLQGEILSHIPPDQLRNSLQLLQSRVEGLLRVERANGEALEAQQTALAREREELNCRERRLRQVHRSYGFPVPALWNSWS